MKNLWFLIIVLITHSLYAGTIATTASDQQHIEYGKQFHHVVPISVKSHEDVLMKGSAVVLNKNWIITAAHVVKDTKSGYIMIDDKKYCLDIVIYHHEFNDDKIGVADIALGYSKRNMDIPFDLELYKKRDEQDKICSVVGYGLTGTFATGAKISDNKKRAGVNRVINIHKNILMCLCDPNKSISMELMIASGDSGGGLFIDGKLAGINSCVLAEDKKPDSDYGDESGHTRISDYAEWIEENIKSKDPILDYNEQYTSYSNTEE